MLYSAISEFPILAIAALGFYISLRFLCFPDLTVDASFMFGMSVVGLSLRQGASSELSALFFAPILGAIVGMITGLLHTSKYLKMNKFLSGMLVAFASYSICYRMCGQADISLFQYRSQLILFRIFEGTHIFVEPIVLSILVFGIWLGIQRLMNSPFGLALRTAGHRSEVLQVSGLNPKHFVILGLAFSNAIIAVAGWLNATINRNVSLKNFGMIINVLASCLIGDFLLHMLIGLFSKSARSRKRSVFFLLLSPIVGAFAYSLIKSFVIKILSGQLRITLTTDLQLIIALVIMLVAMAGKQFNGFDQNDDEGGI